MIAWLSLVRRFVAQKLSRLRRKGGRARVLSYHVNLGSRNSPVVYRLQNSRAENDETNPPLSKVNRYRIVDHMSWYKSKQEPSSGVAYSLALHAPTHKKATSLFTPNYPRERGHLSAEKESDVNRPAVRAEHCNACIVCTEISREPFPELP